MTPRPDAVEIGRRLAEHPPSGYDSRYSESGWAEIAEAVLSIAYGLWIGDPPLTDLEHLCDRALETVDAAIQGPYLAVLTVSGIAYEPNATTAARGRTGHETEGSQDEAMAALMLAATNSFHARLGKRVVIETEEPAP